MKSLLRITLIAATLLVASPTQARHASPTLVASQPAKAIAKGFMGPMTWEIAMRERDAIQSRRDERTGVDSTPVGTYASYELFSPHLLYFTGRTGRNSGSVTVYGYRYEKLQALRNLRMGVKAKATQPAETIAAVQKRRHERTEYLRQLKRMQTELFVPFVWKATAFEPTRPVTLKSTVENLQFTQAARDERTGEKTKVSQLTYRNMMREMDVLTRTRTHCGPRRSKPNLKSDFGAGLRAQEMP